MVLEDWQRDIVDQFSEEFLRGLIHSDGCRTINRFTTRLPSGRVAEYAYPATSSPTSPRTSAPCSARTARSWVFAGRSATAQHLGLPSGLSGEARFLHRTQVLTRLRETLLAASSIVPHTDADGLSAGALALRARNEGADAAVLFTRHGSPWRSPEALPPGRPALLDWGVREFPRPALMIDHHVPETDDPGDDITVFTEQNTSTSAMVRRLVPEQPAWLAAVGAVGDLGDAGFKLPEAHPAPKTAVRRLVSLVNAPRRLPDGPVRHGARAARRA
jgi:hypothetical protein